MLQLLSLIIEANKQTNNGLLFLTIVLYKREMKEEY